MDFLFFLGKDAQSKFITLDGEGQNNFLSVYAPVAFYQTSKFCSIFNHEVSEKFQTAFDPPPPPPPHFRKVMLQVFQKTCKKKLV